MSATRLDFLLPWYDSLVALSTRESATKARLLQSVSPKPGMRMVDVGCGSGTFLQSVYQLASAEPTCPIELVGLDIDPRMLSQARAKLGGSVPEENSRRRLKTETWSRLSASPAFSLKLIQGNCCDLPFDNDAFDVAVSSLVFHHLSACDKLRTLGEIHRVLRPGGRLLLADFCRPCNPFARACFLPVRLLDGWSRTRCNALGLLPKRIAELGFSEIFEAFAISTPLGTIRCHSASKPWTCSTSPR